jgi:hypothetical protein
LKYGWCSLFDGLVLICKMRPFSPGSVSKTSKSSMGIVSESPLVTNRWFNCPKRPLFNETHDQHNRRAQANTSENCLLQSAGY